MSGLSHHIPANFSSAVAVPALAPTLDTRKAFQAAHDDSADSPIDQFIANTLPLNLMWAERDKATQFLRHESLLLVLGYVSAVESYLRALIRRILVIDDIAREACHSLTLSYAAARLHEASMLPEALLEEHSFSNAKQVKAGLKKFLAIEVQDAALNELIDKYGHICELRHCCVHRFGKLGIKNALELGLEEHRIYIEKPVQMDYATIESMAALLTTLVKSLNNFVMSAVLGRSVVKTAANSPLWSWNARKDARLYKKYYDIFASNRDAMRTAPLKDMYRLFRAEQQPISVAILQRRLGNQG